MIIRTWAERSDAERAKFVESLHGDTSHEAIESALFDEDPAFPGIDHEDAHSLVTEIYADLNRPDDVQTVTLEPMDELELTAVGATIGYTGQLALDAGTYHFIAVPTKDGLALTLVRS